MAFEGCAQQTILTHQHPDHPTAMPSGRPAQNPRIARATGVFDFRFYFAVFAGLGSLPEAFFGSVSAEPTKPKSRILPP